MAAELDGVINEHLNTVERAKAFFALQFPRNMSPSPSMLLETIRIHLESVEMGERGLFLQLVGTWLLNTCVITWPLRPNPELVSKLWALRLGRHRSYAFRAETSRGGPNIDDDFKLVAGYFKSQGDDATENAEDMQHLLTLAIVWMSTPLLINPVGRVFLNTVAMFRGLDTEEG